MVIFFYFYCIIKILRVLNFAKNAIREKRENNNDANITTFTVCCKSTTLFYLLICEKRSMDIFSLLG